MLKEFELVSEFDGLMLSCAIYEAEEVKGVIQFSYGMVEYKERYYPFMEFWQRGGTVVLYTTTGTCGSIDNEKD